MEKNLNQIIERYYLSAETLNLSIEELESDPILQPLDAYDWLFIRIKIRDTQTKKNRFEHPLHKIASRLDEVIRDNALNLYIKTLNEKLASIREEKSKLELCINELKSINEEKMSIYLRVRQEQMDIHFLNDFESNMLYNLKYNKVSDKKRNIENSITAKSNFLDGNLFKTLNYNLYDNWFKNVISKIATWDKDNKISYLLELKHSFISLKSSQELVNNPTITITRCNEFADNDYLESNSLDRYIEQLDYYIRKIENNDNVDNIKLQSKISFKKLKHIISYLLNEPFNLKEPLIKITNLDKFLLSAFSFSIVPTVKPSKEQFIIESNSNVSSNEIILVLRILKEKDIIDSKTKIKHLTKWFTSYFGHLKGFSVENIKNNLGSRENEKKLKEIRSYLISVID